MSTLDKLWLLQQHYNVLSDIEKNLKEPSTLEKIKALGILLRNTEKRLEDLQYIIETNEKTLKKNNIFLKDLEYQLKEIEKNLYEENITDIKQLTLLYKERENITNDIENLEIDLLKNMEIIEELRKEQDDLSKTFKEHRKEYTKLVKEHRLLMNQYEIKAQLEKEEIERLMSTIDGEVLKRFHNLIKTKRIAVVEVIDNRCTGCNMVLPSVILDRLKKNAEVILCENCHRILYLPC